jgi:hypothetical protein
VDSEPPTSEEEEEERRKCEEVRRGGRAKEGADLPDQFDFLSEDIEESEYPFQPEGSPPVQVQQSGASLQGIVEETVEEETFERDATGTPYLVKRTRTVRRVVAGSAVAAPVSKGAVGSVGGDGGSAAGIKSVAGNKRKGVGGGEKKKKASSPRPSRIGRFSEGDFVRYSCRSRKSLRESVKDLSCSGETSEDESCASDGEGDSFDAPSILVGAPDDDALVAARALLGLRGGE